MSKTSYVLEKTAAVVIVLNCIWILIGLIYTIYQYQQYYFQYEEQNPDFIFLIESVGSYTLKVRSIIICQLLGIVGGILLVMNKKTGWVLCGSVAITQLFYTCFSLWSYWKGPGYQVLISALFVVVFALVNFLLFSPSVIKKYEPGRRMWTWAFGLAVIFCVDYIFIFRTLA